MEIVYDVNNPQFKTENPTLKIYKLFTSEEDREGWLLWSIFS